MPLNILPSIRISMIPLVLVGILLFSGSSAAQGDLAKSVDDVLPQRVGTVRHALGSPRTHATQLDAFRRRKAPASLRLLIVACDFSDSLMWGRDLAEFPGWPEQRRGPRKILDTNIPMFAAHDSTFFDLQMKRTADYFETVSFGAFRPEWSVFPDILNVDRPMGWYADADSGTLRLVALAQELATRIDGAVDFGQFDTMVIVHAGAGLETDINGDSPEQILSNYLDRRDFERAVDAGILDTPSISTDEAGIGHLLVLPESDTQDPLPGEPFSGFIDVRGVYCFELGLRMGMLSLVDFTPESFPDSQGIGIFGLMGYGLFSGAGSAPSAPSAFNRMLMGWVDPVEVREDASLRIGAMGPDGMAVADTLLLKVPITDQEYWLAEYRLQDPDGDLFYGIDDLNGNRWPDYFDASNVANNGDPDSTFDPDTDTWESELGAEVDFFMSQNAARTRDGCQRGGGSGLYIWHVDEQVIENALLNGTETVNADSGHKGVDVEEADGIQDLDTNRGSFWLFGGDRDCWRGEGADRFGPGTNPSTVSATGLPTGVLFSGISKVVLDTLPMQNGFCTGFVYAKAMQLEVAFGQGAEGPAELARFRLDGHGPVAALRAADLGAGPGSPTPDGRDEIVAVADSGRVYIFDGQLGGFDGGDGLFAVATSGDSLSFRGPAVVEFLGRGVQREIILGTNAGLYGFGIDGQEIADGDLDPSTNGRIADPGGQGLSPAVFAGGRFVQSVQTATGLQLVSVSTGPTDGLLVERSAQLDGVEGGEDLVLAEEDAIYVGYMRGMDPGQARFRLASGGVTDVGPDAPGSSPAALVEFADIGTAAIWIDREDRPVISTVPGGGELRRGSPLDELHSAPVAAPVTGTSSVWVVAVATPDELFAFDANLGILPGFPVETTGDVVVAPGYVVPEPLLVDLDGDGRVEILWTDGAGGLHAIDLDGREKRGWPLQGPASPVGAPAIGQFDGDGDLEMVVAGSFEKLVSGNASERDFVSRRVGELRVYDLGLPANAYAPWSQARAGTDNRGRQLFLGQPAQGSGLVEDSFSVRPNPATGTTVRLRAEAVGGVQARVAIFTLEGERVVARGPLAVPAGTAFDVEVSIEGLASGTYICQLTAGGTVQRRLLAVVR